jgi:hypothetical protein
MKKKTPLKKIQSNGKTVWVTRPNLKDKSLLRKRMNVYNMILNAIDENKDAETIMQIAEDFGKTLFKECIKERPEKWTIKNWLEPVVENIFNPMGAAATFTKITDKEARSLIFRCPVPEQIDKHNIPCLFSYGFARGLLKSAFPKGELLMGKTIANGASLCEFVFKSEASEEDRIEIEKIKQKFKESCKSKHNGEKKDG